MAFLEIEALNKAFGSHAVVRDVAISIEPGEFVSFLGPSGCGKTTTLRMIAGLEMASSGRITIGDIDVTKLPATDRDAANRSSSQLVMTPSRYLAWSAARASAESGKAGQSPTEAPKAASAPSLGVTPSSLHTCSADSASTSR